jgi:catechol 2,3-dioxygenase-like lactoylglutathione lyase family enzyme
MKLLGNFLVIAVFACFTHHVLVAQITGVGAIGITVKEMDRSVKFYTEVLGCKKISDTTIAGAPYEQLYHLFGLHMRIVRLQLGNEFIELTDYLTSGGRSIPEDAKSNDLFFQHIAIVVSNMDKAYNWVRKYHVEHVSTAPQTLPKSIPAAEGIKAFYFHDPDNHNLELIYFPKGKGLEKWQNTGDKLFLGIDHTAIGVSSTENSHQFYMNLLGIERKGDSWNKGTEQAHLNNVEGASLHITGYRAANGVGIEFLEYLVPGPGKKYPADSKTDDIWHWQTILFTTDAKSVYEKLKSARAVFVSQQPVLVGINGAPAVSFMVRDPDGHALLITEKKE